MNARSGAALIIAISVLAALLFLALPFLFSQSASVAGARAASWDGVARRGADRASGLGAALSVYVTTLHRSSQIGAARLAYVQVPLQISSPDLVNFDCVSDGAHRAVLATGSSWTTDSQVIPGIDGAAFTHGVIIEDESRRIDPNCLGEFAWAQVLSRAGIIDPPTLYWSWGPMPGGTGVFAHGRWNQASYGRLARRLALWRPANATRYNRLEDLLGANPNQPDDPPPPRTAGCIPTWPKSYNRSDGRPYWPPGANEAQIEATRNDAENNIPFDFKDPLQVDFATKILGYRVAALTPAELDRLKTQLTFLVPGQGRSGMIDLATVVAVSTNVVEDYGVTHDDLSPDAHLEMGPPLRTSTSWATTIQARIGRQDDNRWQDVDDALAITATPALNINTVPSDSELVRLFSAAADPATEGWPADPVNTPITSIGRLPRLAWLDPRLGNSDSFYDPNIGRSTNRFERPPIGLLGYGTMAIEGAANALDPDGRQVGQRRRRTVMQAVPQEHAVQAVWSSQGEIEALLLSRHGSWVQSGPLPTRRIATYGLAKDGSRDLEAMLALDKAGWLEAAPVCSFGTNPSVVSDWWAPFGLTQPTPWEDITKAFTSQPRQDSVALPTQTPAKQTAGLTDLRPKADGTPGLLTSQGLHLRAGDRIAWEVGANGPLKATTNGDQLNPRHLSFRFRIDAGAAFGSAPMVLMESRASEPGADSQLAYGAGLATAEAGFGEPDAVTDDQFVWRLMYDPAGPGGEQLVLVLANAALPWREADRMRFGIAATWLHMADTPDQAEDGRCLPGTLPFAPPWKAQRVEYRYRAKGGLESGRWYHVQVASGGDQPGHQAVILDGIVGRDAILANAFSETGDHYVFPSLRLSASTPAPPAPGTVGNTHLLYGDMTVLAPPGMTAEDVLPARGLVRIDDEFISYDSISGNVLKNTQRGRRQGTIQTATMDDPADTTAPIDQIADHEYRWPILQGHREGALVVPGWSQMELTNPITGPSNQSIAWRYGAGMLIGPKDKLDEGLPELPPTGTVTSFTPNAVVPMRPVSVIITPTPCPLFGAPTSNTYTFGDRGYVEFYTSATYAWTGRCFFTRAVGSDTLDLDWSIVESVGNLPDSGSHIAVQVSIEIDQPVKPVSTGPPILERFDPQNGLIQLLDIDNGRAEWIGYDKYVELDAAGHFFVQVGGFGRSATATVDPSLLIRGAMRTPWRRHASGPWAGKGSGKGTAVLPVQRRFSNTSRLEAGDVMTIVPEALVIGAVRHAPVQMLVRYACRDGYPASASASGAAHETANDYFALTHQVPTPLIGYTDRQTVLIGRGWGGDDLSPVDNSQSRRGAMPRLAGLGDSAQKAALHVGCGQESPAYAADYTLPTQVGMTIDDLCAGRLHWRADLNAPTASGVIAFGTGSELTSAVDQLPVTITTQGSVFVDCPTYGLVLLDGEVFAYRQMDPPEQDRARLIARGLLGSSRANHRITADVTMPTIKGTALAQPSRDPVRQALPILTLPMGPVGELATELKLNDQGTYLDVIEIPHTSYFRDPPAPGFGHREQEVYANTGGQHLDEAPYQLILDPVDPGRIEVLRLLDYPTQANQRTAAPWLRGLYGSTTQHWQPGFTNFARNRPAAWVDQTPPPNGSGSPIIITLNPQQAADANLNPIIIGWWPRFASGIPASLPSNATQASALLRCRSYAWAGFPLRFYGARFDPGSIPVLSTEGIADVQLADDGGLDVKTRALAAGNGLAELFDWNSSPVGGTGNALKDPFNWNRFTMREVDGAELRVHWVMPTSTTLEGLADAQGRTPRLGNPDSDLGKDPVVGSGIRLRCVAPARVLAVEEVR